MKLLGLSFILISAYYLQKEICYKMKHRQNQLQVFVQSLTTLKGEIIYCNSTLPEICIKLGKRGVGGVEGFFYRVGHTLRENLGNSTFCQVWEKESKPLISELKLDSFRFVQLGRQLSTGDKKEELEQLEWYISQMKDNLKREQHLINERIKVTRSLGLAGGCLIVLLLI